MRELLRLTTLIGCLTTTAFVAEAIADTPRTASGVPDLSGTYNVATLTPLQRPKELADKATLSEEEAKNIAEYWKTNLAKDAEKSDPNREAPPEGGVEIYVPEFSAFYVDIGESNFKLDGAYRTSIITQPANGRMPKLSDQGMQKAMAMRANYHENTGTAWWIDREKGPYDNPENRPLAERCLLGFGSTSGPPALPVMYNNLKRIIQTENSVIIRRTRTGRITKLAGGFSWSLGRQYPGGGYH